MYRTSKSWRKRLEKVVALFNWNLDDTAESIRKIKKNMKESYLIYWRKSLGDELSEEGKL